LIATSATYRQSSRFQPELAARDPDNRLLARQSSLRLSAEQIRDSTLAVSGLLNRTLGGPSVRPPQAESVAMEGFDNKWVAGGPIERHRRGLYTYIQRTSPFAQNVTFDAPPTSLSCTRRERSNTPLQALNLLNDPVFYEAARALAARILRESPETRFEARLDYLFRLCLARPARPGEIDRLRRYLDDQCRLLEAERAAALAAGADSGAAPSAGGSTHDEAWVGLASILLNLDEFITRR
jgi:hypothetical protein